jgi:SAM-dependent methyltransferase
MPGRVESASRSIAFDPAAEYYDRTRGLEPAAHDAVLGQLVGELRGRGRCLEVGVGTGRIALDLHRRGVAMAGVDLSAAMLRKLVQKAGGAPPFPLAVADATALPVADGAVGAALVCHVLHLVDPWRRAVEELVRVVRPGGLVLVESAERAGGPIREVNQRFWTVTSRGSRGIPGLTDVTALDGLLGDLGFRVRQLPPVLQRHEASLGEIIGQLEAGIYAGCWELSEVERLSAAGATREWAAERFGSLDARHAQEQTIVWRAYDAPAGAQGSGCGRRRRPRPAESGSAGVPQQGRGPEVQRGGRPGQHHHVDHEHE